MVAAEPKRDAEAAAALLSCVLADLHPKVFAGLCELYAAEDRATHERLAAMQRLAPKDVGVREDIVFSPDSAVARLCQIDEQPHPMLKARASRQAALAAVPHSPSLPPSRQLSSPSCAMSASRSCNRRAPPTPRTAT